MNTTLYPTNSTTFTPTPTEPPPPLILVDLFYGILSLTCFTIGVLGERISG